MKCAACPSPAGPGHHAIYQQEVRRRGGDLGDPRNFVPLCEPCHAAHHAQMEPLPSRVLPDEVFVFALELMGCGAAYEYIRRRYVVGNDPRPLVLLAEWEHANGVGGEA